MENRLEAFFKKHKITPDAETARSWIFECPACGGKNKLYIQKQDGNTVCFKRKTDKCPSPGSYPTYALSLMTGLSFKEVKGELFDFESQLSDTINVSFDDEVVRTDSPLRMGTLPLDITFLGEPEAEEGTNYLLGRGLDLELLKKQSVMYSAARRRVIFPVIHGKVLYGWQGRAIDNVDKNLRMENLSGDWKAKTLMFYNNIVGKEFAIVTEGAVDALKFAKVGNYVATMGKEISKTQLELLRSSGIRRLYLALDPDAVDKLDKIRQTMDNELHGKVECYVVPVPEHREDFGASTYEECEDAFNKATKLQGDDIFVNIEFKLKGNI